MKTIGVILVALGVLRREKMSQELLVNYELVSHRGDTKLRHAPPINDIMVPLITGGSFNISDDHSRHFCMRFPHPPECPRFPLFQVSL